MMNPKDISNLSAAVVIICTFIIIAAGYKYKKGQPSQIAPKEPRRPIGVAYMEMFEKIYNAKEVSDMKCIKALLKDYLAEYERHEFPSVLQADVRAIKRMRLDKICEIRGTVSRVLV